MSKGSDPRPMKVDKKTFETVEFGNLGRSTRSMGTSTSNDHGGL